MYYFRSHRSQILEGSVVVSNICHGGERIWQLQWSSDLAYAFYKSFEVSLNFSQRACEYQSALDDHQRGAKVNFKYIIAETQSYF
jgi:hypothetical protein